MITRIERENELWRPVNLLGFSYLYQVSNKGRVKSNAYKIFKGGEILNREERILLKDDDKAVFMSNRLYQGMYNIGILYKHTFPNTKLNAG